MTLRVNSNDFLCTRALKENYGKRWQCVTFAGKKKAFLFERNTENQKVVFSKVWRRNGALIEEETPHNIRRKYTLYRHAGQSLYCRHRNTVSILLHFDIGLLPALPPEMAAGIVQIQTKQFLSFEHSPQILIIRNVENQLTHPALSISPIMHSKKHRRSPLRLRFLTIALTSSPRRNIPRKLHRLFSYSA